MANATKSDNFRNYRAHIVSVSDVKMTKQTNPQPYVSCNFTSVKADGATKSGSFNSFGEENVKKLMEFVGKDATLTLIHEPAKSNPRMIGRKLYAIREPAAQKMAA